MVLFYPPEAPVPTGSRTEGFLLRPLRAADAELDFGAVMENPAALRLWSGTNWPADDFTLAGNLADLQMHEREHRERQAFTYTVTTPAGDLCLGCVYLDPLERLLRRGTLSPRAFPEQSRERQVIVRFWVRHSRIAAGLDRELFQNLRAWLDREWAFEGVFFRANGRDERQIALLEAGRLQLLSTVDIAGMKGPYRIYGSVDRSPLPDGGDGGQSVK